MIVLIKKSRICFPKGINDFMQRIMFNNCIIEDGFPFDFIIKDLLVYPEATRRNKGYYT